MPYGLTDDIVNKIHAVFANFVEIEEAIIYGSRAKGNYKPGSDIDLTLKGKGLTLKVLNSISLKLDDLLLPYTFDISRYRQITNTALIAHIERVGHVFYKKQ